MYVKNVWVVALLSLLSVTPAAASPILYDFVPGSSLTDNLGNTETITGSFYYDSTDDTLTDASIILSGPAPFAGTYASTTPAFFLNDPETGVETWHVGPSSAYLSIDFSNSTLATGTASLVVPPSAYCVIITNNTCSDTYVSVTGGVSDVPEPTTLALFGGGLLGLRLIRRRRG
jgi:hypothetical protein